MMSAVLVTTLFAMFFTFLPSDKTHVSLDLIKLTEF